MLEVKHRPEGEVEVPLLSWFGDRHSEPTLHPSMSSLEECKDLRGESVELVVVVASVQPAERYDPRAPMEGTKHRNRRCLGIVRSPNKPTTHTKNTF